MAAGVDAALARFFERLGSLPDAVEPEAAAILELFDAVVVVRDAGLGTQPPEQVRQRARQLRERLERAADALGAAPAEDLRAGAVEVARVVAEALAELERGVS